jgi:molecular chaperone GrpE (heat shock protein)
MYVFKLFVTFHFLIKISVTVLGENSKKFEVTGSDKTIHISMQFSMLIPNMIVLLHKSSVEIYRQKSSVFDQNLVKVIFQNKEKERGTKRIVLL